MTGKDDGLKKEELAMSKKDAFARWFRQATGNEPYPFQIRFACGTTLQNNVAVSMSPSNRE
jgi:hypothetical protein